MLVDAFLFFNELDLLEIRLHEMDPIVDYFVIVESLERFASGKPKAAVFQENRQRFKEFENKIIHFLLPTLEPPFENDTTAWAREYYNRNALMLPIQRVAGPHDTVIISDCDEIPRAAALRGISSLTRIHRLNQRMYHYNVNQLLYRSDTDTHCWDKAIIGTVEQIQAAGGPQEARFVPGAGVIRNAGWHFTYFEDGGSIDRMREKTESCSHFSDPEERTFLAKDNAQLLREIVAGDVIRRESRSCVWRDADDSALPEYFLKNTERFRHFTDAFFRDQLGGRA